MSNCSIKFFSFFSVIRSTTSYRWCKQSRLSFLDACALHFFGKLLSISHYLIFRPNFDEFSTDVHSTRCLSTKIRRMVAFDVMSGSTGSRIRRKGFRRKVMDAIKYAIDFNHVTARWRARFIGIFA